MQILIKHRGKHHIPNSKSSTWDVCKNCSLSTLCKRNYTHNSLNGYIVYNICALTNTNGFKIKKVKHEPDV